MKSLPLMLLLVGGAALAGLPPKADPEVEASRIAATLVEQEMILRATKCFDDSRMILLGYSSKQQGIPIEKYEMLKPETREHALVQQGYGLSSIMDDAIPDYFYLCIEQP